MTDDDRSGTDLIADVLESVRTTASREAIDVCTSIYLWVIGVLTALVAGLVAFMIGPVYVHGIQTAQSLAADVEAPLEEVLEPEHLEPLELVLGPEPSVEEVTAVLETLSATGDLYGTVILSAYVFGFGPILGLLVTVPAIVRRRRSDRFTTLRAAGHGPGGIVFGTFLGRSVGAMAMMAVVATVVGAVVHVTVAPVGFTYLLVAALAALSVTLFAAIGTAIAVAAGRKLTAWLGAIGFLLVYWVLTGYQPMRSASATAGSPDGVLEVVVSPPGAFLPGVLQRLHPYNLLLDLTGFVGLSGTIEAFPRLSYAGLAWVLSQDDAPLAAVETLPVTLGLSFTAVVFVLWLAVPLAIAIVLFDPELE